LTRESCRSGVFRALLQPPTTTTHHDERRPPGPDVLRVHLNPYSVCSAPAPRLFSCLLPSYCIIPLLLSLHLLVRLKWNAALPALPWFLSGAPCKGWRRMMMCVCDVVCRHCTHIQTRTSHTHRTSRTLTHTHARTHCRGSTHRSEMRLYSCCNFQTRPRVEM
jgi:hypothetical protein